MKILYITVQTPYGKGETFILEEMLELKRQGVNLLIAPRNPSKQIFHEKSKKLLKNTIRLPLINSEILKVFLVSLLKKNSIWKILGTFIRRSRNFWIFTKNLAVLPKGVFIAKNIQRHKIIHIHSHWGSTTATMAYIISQLTGIPWSFTLHRWDIKENNLLKEKCKTAKFIRCISEHGKKELLKIIGNNYAKKVYVIHMGIKISDKLETPKERNCDIFQVVVPARLCEVKGHKYLIEAISYLNKHNHDKIKNLRCTFYGDGPLKRKLKRLIKKKKLSKYIKICPFIPHEKLINIYKNNKADLVILPSINTKGGQHEGIPVSLMEAMSYKIPVISTNTGGIPELLSNNAGIIVEEKNPKEIAKAIEYLIEHPDEAKKMGENGRKAVLEKYNWESESKKLLKIYEKLTEK